MRFPTNAFITNVESRVSRKSGNTYFVANVLDENTGKTFPAYLAKDNLQKLIDGLSKMQYNEIVCNYDGFLTIVDLA